jgi:hypothetical protein
MGYMWRLAREMARAGVAGERSLDLRTCHSELSRAQALSLKAETMRSVIPVQAGIQ